MSNIEKNYEVYTETFPWMIGRQVEIGVYEEHIDFPGEAGDLVATNGGFLEGYSADTTSVEFLFKSSLPNGAVLSVPASRVYLISVVESNQPRPV
jgi:hypothetical protein